MAIGTNLLHAQAKALQLANSLFVLTTQTQEWFVEHGFADATVEDLSNTNNHFTTGSAVCAAETAGQPLSTLHPALSKERNG